MTRRLVSVWLLCLASCALTQPMAHAGISPENVIVVVNATSKDSRTLANYYVDLRKIPSSNVIFLEDVPAGLIISLNDFKQKILGPLLKTLNERRLAAQARVIAYSIDFPTSVTIGEHTKKLTNPSLMRYQRPTASITGLTFFYQYVLGNDPGYLGLSSNLYARGSFDRNWRNPFLDKENRAKFDAATKELRAEQWDPAGDKFEELSDEFPTISPLAIRAAEARAGAGDTEAASDLLVQAVRGGWKSKKAIDEMPLLAPLLDEPVLELAKSVLSDVPDSVQYPVGFNGAAAWTLSGNRISQRNAGVMYMLSCMLGVVHPRGSTLEQAIEVLQRSSKADFTNPDGKFLFTQSSDVRTKTRLVGVLDAMQWLRFLDRDAELIKGAVPKVAGRLSGLMLGAATTDLVVRPWTFNPGAIADNLTSHGGNFRIKAQTKMTELLHAGAAMTSGTVDEPFSLQAKFPLPIMYGYYASGVSAVEAFYLSVASPYQLLIVGDPMTQPFSRPPSDIVSMASQPNPDGPTRVEISRELIETKGRLPTGAMEIYFEGKLLSQLPPRSKLQINLPQESAGTVKLGLVLIGNDPVEPRVSHEQWIELPSDQPSPVAEVRDPQAADPMVRVSYPGATAIDLMHHGEKIGTVEGDEGEIKVRRFKYGDGPIRIRPLAKVGEQTIPGKALVIE